jgi:hypothetical protein
VIYDSIVDGEFRKDTMGAFVVGFPEAPERYREIDALPEPQA